MSRLPPTADFATIPVRRRAAPPVRRGGLLALGLGIGLAAAGPAGCGSPAPDPPASPTMTDAPPDAASAGVSSANDLVAATDAWHAGRLADLTAEDGWLSLVALAWLRPGANDVGRDPAMPVAYAGLPADRLGTLHVSEGGVRFEPAPGATVDGIPAGGELVVDAAGDPTVLRAGTCRFHVIERGGELAVRLKDSAAPTRTGFAGIPRYPADAAWRIEAAFVPGADGETVDVETILGHVEASRVAGRARFTHAGHAVDLVLSEAGAGRFFVVFGDLTNGETTYPSGRFLLAEQTGPDTVVLDFNRAYMPPCAFTAFATCPLPVPGNRLPFAVPAGERMMTSAAGGAAAPGH